MPRDTTVSLATLRALARKSCSRPTITARMLNAFECRIDVSDDDGHILTAFGRDASEAHAMAAAALAARSGR